MSDSESLVDQLKARRVVRGAIAHVVIAWLFVQIADVVFPYLGVGDGAVRWVLVVSVATFPVTLFIAWLSDQPWSGSGHPVPEAVVLVLIAVTAGWWVQGNLPEAARERTSIVIMPFEHGSDDIDANLSRALTDEVASLLMRSKSIDVIAPESANSSLLQGLGTVAIADRLSVGSVLQGSVTAQGDAMRIELRLLDAVGDLLWTGIVEDSFSNLMNVQARIAREVERRLGVGGEDTVSVEQVAAERCWMPADSGALQKYFTARHYIELRTGTPESQRQIGEAIAIYTRLLEQYPDFAEARAGLAWAYEYQATYDRENAIENYRQVASATAAEALEDCPTLGEAMHLAPNQYKHENPWIGAWKQLTAAIDMEPHKMENHQRLVRHYRETGLDQRALETAEHLVSINPLSVRALKELASVYMHFERYEDSIALYESSIELGNTAPNWATGAEQLDRCDEDIECILDNLYPPHQPYKERLRIVYRTPANAAEAETSIDVAMQLFHDDPIIFTNWLSGSACKFEHLAPLFFDVWSGSKARGSYWHWPNVWGDACINVHSLPEFPALVEEVGLDDYWREVGWPTSCQPHGETFACGRNRSIPGQ